MTRTSRRIAQTVSESVHRFDRVAVRLETFAQPPDVRVDGARIRFGRNPPNLLQELGAGEHAARVLDEDREKLVLERPERKLLVVDRNAMSRGIDLETAPREAPALVARA